MTALQQDTLLPPNWNKAARLRQEKIAKRLAESGSKAKEMNIEAIRTRRERLEELTKAMKSPKSDKRRSSMVPSAKSGKGNVKLEPIGTPSPNQLDKKKRDDALLKKSKSSHRSSSQSPTPYDTKYEEELMQSWRKGRVMGDDIRRSFLNEQDYEYDDDEEEEEEGEGEQEEEEGEEEESEEEEEVQEEDNDSGDNDDESDGNGGVGEGETGKYESSAFEKVNEKNVREIIRQIKGRTEEERLIGTYRARKHLSVEKDPPFDTYIDAGAIPPLVSCLSSYNPNLQFEAAWALTNISSGSTEHAMAVYEGGALPELIVLLSSPYNRVSDQCVWTIGNLAGDSSFLWQTVIDEGAIKPLYYLIEKSPSLSSLRNLSWAFSNILRHKPLNLSHSDLSLCIKAVRLFLHHPDKEIHLNACWSVVYITDNGNERIEETLKAGILPRIIEELLDTTDKKTVTPALRALGNIMTGTDEQTDQVVNAGVIPVLVRHLDHSSCNIRKDCAWALSNIMAGTEIQIQKVIDANAFPQLVVAINKDEPRVKKEAIWCVSNLTQSGSQAQIDEAICENLLESLVRSISKKTLEVDKQQLHVTLEGIKNILEKCSDPEEATTIILEELSLKNIEKLTYDDEKAISAIAAKLHLILSEHSDDQ